MDARSLLARLIAPLTLGDELMGHRIEEITEAHGMRLVVSRGDKRVFLDVDAREDGYPFAASTSRLAISYRSARQNEPMLAREGRALADALAAVLVRNEAAVLDAFAEQSRTMTRIEGTARVREVRVSHALEGAGEGEAAFDTVSPYVGCLIGCSFCYAQERLGRTRALLGLADVAWGSWVDARVNVAEVLRAELARAPARPLKLCPIVSDPYHAIERRHRLTRGVLEVLRDDGRRDALVLTRSAMVRDDLELLASMRAHLGFSIPTLREEVRAVLEPRSAPIAERLAILGEARSRGVRTFAMVQPIFDRDVAALADALAAACDSVQLDVLRGAYGAKDTLAAPALRELARDDVQVELAEALRHALVKRGVAVWSGELPPDLVYAPAR